MTENGCESPGKRARKAIEVVENVSTLHDCIKEWTNLKQEKRISHILLIFAMQGEGQLIIDHFKLQRASAPFDEICPCVLYSGEYEDTKLSLVLNGKSKDHGVDEVGTVPAALSTYIAITKLKPDIIINAGTAGGFEAKGGEIGDVYISTRIANHDRRIPILEYIPYARSTYECVPTPQLLKVTALPLLSDNSIQLHKFKSGVVSTSNSLDHTEECTRIMRENDASVKEMEACGIAWVAELAHIPLLCVKVLTDLVDNETEAPNYEQFLTNFNAAVASLKDAMPKIIGHIAGRRISDL